MIAKYLTTVLAGLPLRRYSTGGLRFIAPTPICITLQILDRYQDAMIFAPHIFLYGGNSMWMEHRHTPSLS